MLNNIISNVVGCPSIEGCHCRDCVPSQSFGDTTRQASFYFKTHHQNLIKNHAFGSLTCYLVDYQDVRTPCTMFLPYGKTEGNVFHCKVGEAKSEAMSTQRRHYRRKLHHCPNPLTLFTIRFALRSPLVGIQQIHSHERWSRMAMATSRISTPVAPSKRMVMIMESRLLLPTTQSTIFEVRQRSSSISPTTDHYQLSAHRFAPRRLRRSFLRVLGRAIYRHSYSRTYGTLRQDLFQVQGNGPVLHKLRTHSIFLCWPERPWR